MQSFMSTFARHSIKAETEYNHQQSALSAPNQQQVAPRGSYEMTTAWDDGSFDFAPSTLTGSSYYGPSQAQMSATQWSLLPPQSHLGNTPRMLPSSFGSGQMSANADEGLQQSQIMPLSSSTPAHRPQNIKTFPYVFMAHPDVSPISAVSFNTGATSTDTPTFASAFNASAMPSPTSSPTLLKPVQTLPFHSVVAKKPSTRSKRGKLDSWDEPDNIRIWVIRRETHMVWDDIATRMNEEDAARGKVSDWTHAAVYNRWCRNAKKIHNKYYKNDKGFNFKKFKYQKKERSDGKKRKSAVRAKSAKVEKEEERQEEGDEVMDEDEEMLEQLEEDQESDTVKVADNYPAQSHHAASDTNLAAFTDDLTTLRSCHDQILAMQRAEFWNLVADKMNEGVVADINESKLSNKSWSAEECEAVMQAGGA